MTCEHPGCSLNIFSTCINHCKQNVCLEHLIEHGDRFLHDFTDLLNQLDKSTCNLITEVTNTATQIVQRRQLEIDRINRMYNEEQQEIRKRLVFAEAANTLLKEKQNQLTNSNQQNECCIAQYDFEQIKSYAIQIKKSSLDKQEKPITKYEKNEPSSSFQKITNSTQTYPCPLFQPNAFGIKLEHNIRFDCDGSKYTKYSLIKHFEYYHRMLPECAIRLRDAIIDGQSPEQTNLFSDHEILLNQEYLIDCPLTDSTNVYGARSTLNTLMHIPCTKKRLTSPSMINHFHLYHKMKYDVAKTIYEALKTKSLHSDLILFDKNQRIGTHFKKKSI